MPPENTLPRRRGRPPKRIDDRFDTREALVRAGLAMLTEKGFVATGIDEVLRQVGVPKGSFYHYFESKEAFGLAAIDAYGEYFGNKLDQVFGDVSMPPLARLSAFVASAGEGMARFDFRRGCLIGNLGQEMSNLPESFRRRLGEVFRDWELRLARCLAAAQQAGELAVDIDCNALATQFWIGWEGAELRAKLERSTDPLTAYLKLYLAALKR
jgi:TetR/AcrR family transcriptional repressor of nem operon